MKRILFSAAAFVLITVTSCKEKAGVNDSMNDSKEMDVEDVNFETTKLIKIAMGSKSGSNVSGNITLSQIKGKVNMKVNLTGLAAGDHAIHVHENGDCSSDDGKSAGGHWNPTTMDHGKWGDDKFHMGDIGNLVADANGVATLTFSTDKWCLDCDDATKNLIGKSFIVHAKADDFKTQPTGDAGGRVACGVIEE